MLRELRLRQKKRFSYKRLCIDMSLKVKKVSHGIFQALYQYVKANNKYMKDYDKNLVVKDIFFSWCLISWKFT